MKRILWTLTALLVLTQGASAEESATTDTKVEIVTSMGTIVVALDAQHAPKTVENFLGYVDESFFDGTIFHRVIPGFMIQGGGFTPDMKKKDTRAGIQNEADNGLQNTRGTIAMARTMDPHSATAQFFINHVDNRNLDHTAKNPRGWGYTVFGTVVEGLEVVDAIAKVKTGNVGPFANVPKDTVTIETIRRVAD